MNQLENLNITLTKDEMKDVQRQVTSGHYASVSEVVRAGLRALALEAQQHADRLGSIRRQIDTAMDPTRPTHSANQVREHMKLRIQEFKPNDRVNARSHDAS